MIASIHQPSTLTFRLFDRLLLLSDGRIAYNGATAGVQPYFASLGFDMPLYTNPAEYILDLVNTDFARDQVKAASQLNEIQTTWTKSANATNLANEMLAESMDGTQSFVGEGEVAANPLMVPFTLVHRSFIKSYRDVVAYGIRIAMYMGLAILMGTVWLRLGTEQKNIQSFINAIVWPTFPQQMKQ